MEVNGYVDGSLLYIGVPAGEAAKVNQIIAIIGKPGEDYKSLLDTGESVKTAEDVTTALAPVAEVPQTAEKTITSAGL